MGQTRQTGASAPEIHEEWCHQHSSRVSWHFIVTKRGTCNIHIVTGKGHKKTKKCLLSKSKQEALYLNFEELPKANPESYHFLSCTHNEASTPNQDKTIWSKLRHNTPTCKMYLKVVTLHSCTLREKNLILK